MADLFCPAVAGWCLSVVFWRFFSAVAQTAEFVADPERVTLLAISREGALA